MMTMPFLGGDAMDYVIKKQGESWSFPEGDPFLEGASSEGDIVLHLGTPFEADAEKMAVLVELGTECLGKHTGENVGREGSNALGFARYRNGEDPPSNIIELVRQPMTDDGAITAASAMFEAAGLEVAVSADQAGRIIDRLVRPKYNAALTFLDEGLASADDLDLTCRQCMRTARSSAWSVVVLLAISTLPTRCLTSMAHRNRAWAAGNCYQAEMVTE